ncbi:MAG: hypothetical protein RJA13_889 [Bacteroidota bacterium]
MRILMSCGFIFLTFLATSQVVNIENRRIYDDTSGWSGAFDAGFSAVQNKDLLLNASFRPRLQYKTKKHYYLFLTDWYYSKGADRVYANTGMVHFRYAYRLNKKNSTKKSPWKWESYAQIQYNQLLDQRLRTLAGTGLRIKALDKKGYRIFAGTSTFYEYEAIQSSDLIQKNFRWSNYISWYFNPKPSFSFSAVTYFQPLWNNLNDFRFMGQYTLTFNTFKRMDFRFEFNNFFDSKPPKDVRNWIFNTSVGIRIRLGE